MSDDAFDKLLDGIQDSTEESTGSGSHRGPGRPTDPDSLTAQLERGHARQLKAIVPADLHRRLKAVAAMTDRQISEIVTEAIQEWLGNHAD